MLLPITYRKFYIHLLVLGAVLFYSYCGFPQQNTPKIKQFTLESGLPQASINDMLLDNDGFVWIATTNGLSRFDGHKFKNYTHRANDSVSISNNYVNDLEFDEIGNIWIGTNGNGLDVFQPDKNSFRSIDLEEFGKDLIINGVKRYKDKMYASSPQFGIFQIDVPNKTLESSHTLNDITSIYVDKKNDLLWIGDLNGNIYSSSLNGSINPVKKIQLSGNIQGFYRLGNLLLVGSYDGLYIYDVISGAEELIELETSQNFDTKHVVDFLMENENAVWIATGRGLYLLQLPTRKVIQKIEYGPEKQSITNNTVTSLLRLNKNAIFAGTANGLNLINFAAPFFDNLSKDKRGEHILNDNVVFSIYKSGNDLLIGTSDGGLNYIKNGKAYQFLDTDKSPKSFVGTVVREICEDTINHRYWFATTRGLSMADSQNFDPERPEFVEFKHNPKDTNSITTDFLKGLALDGNQNLWGAAYQYGLFRLEYANDGSHKITRFLNEVGNANSLINDVTQCVRVDRDNNIWIGTGGGLSVLSFEGPNYSKPKFRHFTTDSLQNSKSYLSNNSVYDINFFGDVVWLGTANGLNRINKDGSVDRWYKQQQFEDTFIYTIQDDDDGNLWLGTNDGLVRFNPKTEIFTRYTEDDNIQSKEFNIHARFKDEDGTIYMGGIGGVTYFKPESLTRLDLPKKLYFSKLEVKDKIIEPYSQTDNILNKDISKTERLRISNNQFPFYLTFSELDFGYGRNRRYAYKLLPSDDEWNYLEDNKIQFLNLPWGTHTLLVNGFSRGKEWNTEPLKMTLDILPPWWLSSWMLFIYALVLMFLGYRFYRFMLSRNLARAESNQLKEVQALRSNFYTNITHEFRTPLTVILGMAEKLRFQNPESVELFKPIALIERNGKKLLSLINNMLDLSKIEEGTVSLNWVQNDIIPYIKYLIESFQTLAEQKDIQLMLFTEMEHLDMDYDEEVIQIILTNLVSNALKFTPKFGKIIINLEKGHIEDKKSLVIKVRDDGMGIPAEDIDKIFDRFYQVNTTISKSGLGSGIGLALVKQLLSLLKGEISVNSLLGEGSEFIAKIPILNKAPLHFTNYKTEALNKTENVVKEAIVDFIDNEDAPQILIIEDNEDVAYYIISCLEADYRVFHRLSGKEGVKLAEEEIPDIVITDLMMPEMNGFEVCRLLRANEKTDHIPLIILTAKDTDEDKLIGLSIGIEAYLTKPFNKEELLTRIETLIIQRKKLQEKYQSVLSVKESPKEIAKIVQPKFLQKVDKIIQECINNPDLNAEFLSEKLGMSESQIYRKLKALTDKSTAIYIRQVRLHKAYAMLKSGDRGVAEIAYDTGFKDPSWFSRSFKEEFGCAPSSLLQK